MILSTGVLSSLLIIVGLANFLLGALTFVRVGSKREASDTSFALIAVSVSLWTLSRAFFEISTTEPFIEIWASVLYISAAFIPVFFLLFSLTFAYKTIAWRKAVYFIVLGCVATIFLTATPGIVIKSISGTVNKIILFGPGYVFYSAYIILYFLAAFFILAVKYFQISSVLLKEQIKYIFAGTFIATSIGVTTNLVLPAIGYFKLFWLGPVSSIIMTVFIGYAIIKHHLFNIKIIAVEFSTFVIWATFTAQVFLAKTMSERIINIALALMVLVAGALLIHEVRKEIHRREQISNLAVDLAIANKHLRELEAQKSEFVSIASHQLRTPLTVIKGYTSMLLEGSFGKMSEDSKKITEKMFSASQRLVGLVEDLLTISRIERGKIQYNFEKVDLEKIIKDAIKDKRADFEEKKLNLTFQHEGSNAPYFVLGDYAKLKQAINNVFNNAIMYTPRGFVRAGLSRDKVLGIIRLSVSDTGIGMKESKVKLLFNENEGKVPAEAAVLSGIGTYIVGQIINAHKGRVWADSPGVGGGTTVFVELPEYENHKK